MARKNEEMNLGQIAFLGSWTAVILAAIGFLWADIFLASTQWLLVGVFLMGAANYWRD